ncbi:Hsp20/alpha crystallin family protein [Sulfobacillus thermosulfidooxidans]|uniref:Hsp20/alpha crystallin family protein n=1 Tax=Sulfobacillus thermosulfidooxidans TaxID=28034 RepID=UPI00096B8925|nr:Hsp20/alpha crystallin family protein [Sulfobacillus thermosulfidooxidans]OLZ08795.1 heat-shock protein Hsp20 [Sulfobacillus thermosulfidooxidans]OLZ14303.1 heat-shock protein Hsp20 [Sulfobacillus thermosulfidooxidans]OLZ19046.1 heat-shock protein Hsp20 [Sulfobacillus thermosulfidooxidans]
MLMRWDPTDIQHFRNDMSRVWNRMRDDWNLDDTKPRTHLHQIENGYMAEFELPGVDPDLVNIEVDEESISVKGTFPASPLEQDKREGEEFQAVVGFPTEIDPESAEAEYKYGLLRVKVYKATGRRKKISISSAAH